MTDQNDSTPIARIRNDPTWLITYGYIVLCFVAVGFGILDIIYLREYLFGVGMILTGLIGLEGWTGWGMRYYQRLRYR